MKGEDSMEKNKFYENRMVEVIPIGGKGKYGYFIDRILSQHAKFYAIKKSELEIMICVKFKGGKVEKYHYFSTEKTSTFSRCYKIKDGKPVAFKRSDLADEVQNWLA